MMVEWLVVLLFAYDIDQLISSRNGVTGRVLLFLQNIWWKSNLKMQKFVAVSPQVENINIFEKVTTVNSYTYS